MAAAGAIPVHSDPQNTDCPAAKRGAVPLAGIVTREHSPANPPATHELAFLQGRESDDRRSGVPAEKVIVKPLPAM